MIHDSGRTYTVAEERIYSTMLDRGGWFNIDELRAMFGDTQETAQAIVSLWNDGWLRQRDRFTDPEWSAVVKNTPYNRERLS